MIHARGRRRGLRAGWTDIQLALVAACIPLSAALSLMIR